jgi:hypothetical protein
MAMQLNLDKQRMTQILTENLGTKTIGSSTMTMIQLKKGALCGAVSGPKIHYWYPEHLDLTPQRTPPQKKI